MPDDSISVVWILTTRRARSLENEEPEVEVEKKWGCSYTGAAPIFFLSLWLRVTVTLCPELAEVLDAGGKGVALDAGTKLARDGFH